MTLQTREQMLQGYLREIRTRGPKASPNPYRSHHMTNTDTTLAAELTAIRDSVDAFNPDARMASLSLFEAMEALWGKLPDILAALTKPAVPDVREALEPAISILQDYIHFLHRIPADDLELHPYIPAVEDAFDRLSAALAALDTAPRSCCEAGRWQPIETAPKGQGLIDIWTTHHGGTRYTSCYYDNICGEWRTSRPAGRLHRIPEGFVTHWQPLPKPPATAIR